MRLPNPPGTISNAPVIFLQAIAIAIFRRVRAPCFDGFGLGKDFVFKLREHLVATLVRRGLEFRLPFAHPGTVLFTDPA